MDLQLGTILAGKAVGGRKEGDEAVIEELAARRYPQSELPWLGTAPVSRVETSRTAGPKAG